MEDLVIKPKKLLTTSRILILVALILVVTFSHWFLLTPQIQGLENEKMWFLTFFTLFIFAPIASLFLSTILALYTIYKEPYLKKYVFFSLIVLLLAESILLCITLFGY